MDTELVWWTISRASEIVGILSFGIFLAAAGVMLQERRRLKKKLLSLEAGEGLSKRPVAIVIGIGKDPTASVRNFLADNNWAEVPIISWVAEGFLKPENYSEAMVKINGLRDQALKLGVSEVLLFYAGPVDLGMFTGASLKNWVPVKVFAFSNGTYEMRFTLERESSRMRSVSDELTNTASTLLNP